MPPKSFRFFQISAGVLLLITGVAKIISGLGHADILRYADPIFKIAFRQLFLMVGATEAVIALICFFSRRRVLPMAFIACIATNFLLYRLSLKWIGYHRPCSCLGNLTDALDISPKIVDSVMEVILAYLLIGSYLMLFWIWNEKRKKPLTMTDRPQNLMAS